MDVTVLKSSCEHTAHEGRVEGDEERRPVGGKWDSMGDGHSQNT